MHSTVSTAIAAGFFAVAVLGQRTAWRSVRLYNKGGRDGYIAPAGVAALAKMLGK